MIEMADSLRYRDTWAWTVGLVGGSVGTHVGVFVGSWLWSVDKEFGR